MVGRTARIIPSESQHPVKMPRASEAGKSLLKVF